MNAIDLIEMLVAMDQQDFVAISANFSEKRKIQETEKSVWVGPRSEVWQEYAFITAKEWYVPFECLSEFQIQCHIKALAAEVINRQVDSGLELSSRIRGTMY